MPFYFVCLEKCQEQSTQEEGRCVYYLVDSVKDLLQAPWRLLVMVQKPLLGKGPERLVTGKAGQAGAHLGPNCASARHLQRTVAGDFMVDRVHRAHGCSSCALPPDRLGLMLLIWSHLSGHA